MGRVMSRALTPQMMAMMQQPGAGKGMADMVEEMSKLKGIPVLQIMRMGTTADGSPLPAASEAPLPTGPPPPYGRRCGEDRGDEQPSVWWLRQEEEAGRCTGGGRGGASHVHGAGGDEHADDELFAGGGGCVCICATGGLQASGAEAD